MQLKLGVRKLRRLISVDNNIIQTSFWDVMNAFVIWRALQGRISEWGSIVEMNDERTSPVSPHDFVTGFGDTRSWGDGKVASAIDVKLHLGAFIVFLEPKYHLTIPRSDGNDDGEHQACGGPPRVVPG